jgi:hypothetical protein
MSKEQLLVRIRELQKHMKKPESNEQASLLIDEWLRLCHQLRLAGG